MRIREMRSAKMKRLIKSAAVMLAMIWCIGQAFPVYASGNPSVVLESDGADMKNRTLRVECNMKNAAQVTNGKVRVTYDAGRLKLLENQPGSLFADSDALCEVNDCLTGNKKEGEIVFAFASAKKLAAEGSLADMSFALSDQASEGDEIKLKVTVEKIAGEEGDLPSESKGLTVKLKKDDPGNNNNNNNNNNNGGSGDNNGNNGGGNNGAGERPGITGGSQSGTSGVRGGSTAGIAGSRTRTGGDNGSSADSSIKSSRSSSEKDKEKDKEDRKNSDGKDTEDTASPEEQLTAASDGQVPMAGPGNGGSYWWILPLIVLVAVAAFFAGKRQQKGKETENPQK